MESDLIYYAFRHTSRSHSPSTPKIFCVPTFATTSVTFFINIINIATTDTMDLDNESELSVLEFADVPTPVGDESPTIRALYEAKCETDYAYLIGQIPRDNKIKLNGVEYIKYDLYRSKKSVRKAWYWDPKQAVELIRVTKGQYHTLFLL